MNRPRTTIPLIPELADIRLRHNLVERRVNTGLFDGWGVRLPMNLPW